MTAQHGRRGVAALTGLTAAALGVVGVADHVDADAQQQDVALMTSWVAPNPGYDDAHTALIHAQVGQDNSLFNHDVAMQENIYYWVGQQLNMDPSKVLFSGDATDPQDSIFNGAFSRFTEAQLVSQAMTQVQLDHMLGLNQTLGAGGYETQIADSLYTNLSGAGIPATGGLHDAIEALNIGATGAVDPTSFSAFSGALSDLQGALMSSAWSDLLGMFSISDAAP
ncbi:hypothetical protein KIH27_13030 [Mycobacterium sp. M1]|uniref:Uncharacterized protein n=1 Tax=Mycolicibacter acidiphilus TaxID=2835306 RepID=A0ABS5RJN2_9MYCO|nr:hypothetical protein [Mycolicibacter acidiphilus]MBS9534510.1 hypothetical protein [Mycolicibacter acidiphilus]